MDYFMRHTLVCLGLLAQCATASAQSIEDEEGWRFTLGAGGLYAPTYEGDDDYRLSILPDVQVTYGDRFFASVQQGAGYRWVNSDNLRLGPIARLKFERSDDGDQSFAVTGDNTSDLRGLGDVDTSVELGGFAEYDIGSLTLSFEARHAVTGHEGTVADLGVRWSGRTSTFGAPARWSVGPRMRFVDDDYNAAYFGVTGSQSIASGLPVYDAGGGLYSYGVGASVVLPLGADQWSLVALASYDRLVGDAGDSPLVQLRGSQDQASVGLFVSRSF
jgi:outer membrane protein